MAQQTTQHIQEHLLEPKIYGHLTYADISHTDDFFAAPALDAFGVLRKPFSRAIARMSAELAANIYDLHMSQWIQAGFEDCCFILEDRIVDLDAVGDSHLSEIEAEWRRRRARSRLQSTRPLSDLIRGVRSFFVTDMGKGIVMVRNLEDGRTIVAISFIGTTQKFFDWMTNFKFQSSEGMHQGFLDLTRHFDALSERIRLPSMASAQAGAEMTLSDAIESASAGDKNIVFWLSGHSQGGALVQTYARRLVQRGVDASQIVGYSFAAPKVAIAGGVEDESAYPIYNIISADDIVPRIGAQVRLGVDMIYYPDEAFRGMYYRCEGEHAASVERMLFIGKQVMTMEDALCFGIACMQMLSDAKPGTDMRLLFSQFVPFLAVANRVGFGPQELARYATAKLTEHHNDLCGQAPNDLLVSRYEDMLRNHVAEFGARETSHALMHAMAAPHVIRPDRKDDAYIPPYLAIVRRHLDEMQSGVWTDESGIYCKTCMGDILLPGTRTICNMEYNGNE